MRKSAIAEWILSLAMPPEHVASTVGDLIEDNRGPLWFWTAIARTVVAFVWRDLAADGIRMAGNALMDWCVYAFSFLAIQALWHVPGFLWSHSYRELLPKLWSSIPAYWNSGPMFLLWIFWFPVSTQSRGKELLTWLVTGLVWISLCGLTGVPTDGVTVGVVVLCLFVRARRRFRSRISHV